MQSYPEALFLLSTEHQHRLLGDTELARHRAEARRSRRRGWLRRRGKPTGTPHRFAAKSGASTPAPPIASAPDKAAAKSGASTPAPPIASAEDLAAATLAPCAPRGAGGRAAASAAPTR